MPSGHRSTSRSRPACLDSPPAPSVKPSAAPEGRTLRPRPRLQPDRPQGHPLVDRQASQRGCELPRPSV